MTTHAMAGFFNRVWYEQSAWQRILLPLSWLYANVTDARRRLYRAGVLRSRDAPVPVVVVGNITVGGTGKTPVTLWLAECLKARSFRPGIASRGYGGRVGPEPLHVTDASEPGRVGDVPRQRDCYVPWRQPANSCPGAANRASDRNCDTYRDGVGRPRSEQR